MNSGNEWAALDMLKTGIMRFISKKKYENFRAYLLNTMQPNSNSSALDNPIYSPPDDRPIVAAGTYNLDFIDWNNEYEYIFSGHDTMGSNESHSFSGYNVPYGVSHETFATIISQMQGDNEEDANGLPEEMILKVKKIIIEEPDKECSVCFHRLQKGESVRKLPCLHCFHDQCLTPWLKRNTTCPNCRYDLFQFFTLNGHGLYL